MNIPLLFKQYIWLVETIRNAKRITFAEINRKWVDTDMSCGVEHTAARANQQECGSCCATRTVTKGETAFTKTPLNRTNFGSSDKWL